jgi:hypothetical protein
MAEALEMAGGRKIQSQGALPGTILPHGLTIP